MFKNPELHDRLPLSPAEFHLLMVLARGALYGYAILQAMASESGGAVRPEIGSLYRMIGRLVGEGYVEETESPEGDHVASPGRPRRYYRLTGRGVALFRAEVERLREALRIVDGDDMIPAGGS